MDVLWDIQFTLLSWIQNVWQLGVENVHEYAANDDWETGHYLLIYTASVARQLLDWYQRRSSG